MTVVIENLRRFNLPLEAAQILKKIFADYKRVVIQNEFSRGLGGNRVILVRPIRTDGTVELLMVVKLAAIGLLEKEWRAYQACIRDRLPNAARAQGPPVTLPGSDWSGLCYPLLGGGGTFKADSLHDYVRSLDVTATDTRFVLDRLLKIIKPILQFHRPRAEFRLRA
ncbi:MAG: hypothetical protein GY726_06940, partial [Proteobacteria bacterium]|nr:hypothetical protein [Pseudomonadota bacterium]